LRRSLKWGDSLLRNPTQIVSSNCKEETLNKFLSKKCSIVMYHLTLLALVALIGGCRAADGDVNICSDVVSNLFLPHVSNCSKYYLCMSE